MKRKTWIPFLAIILLATVDVSAQRWKLQRYELDMYIGGVAFHGDIGLADRPFQNMINGYRPSLGVIPKFYLREDVTIGLDLGYYMYGGVDEEGSSHGRYYSFNSNAFLHGIRAEYYILGGHKRTFNGAVYNRRGMVNSYNRLNLLVFAGVSGIVSKSTVKDLANGGAEPVTNPGYNNNAVYSVVFPIGLGLKWGLSPYWAIGLDMSYSFSTSDLLDGYAPEASNYNDSFYLLSVKGVYKIRNDRRGVPIFRHSNSGYR